MSFREHFADKRNEIYGNYWASVNRSLRDPEMPGVLRAWGRVASAAIAGAGVVVVLPVSAGLAAVEAHRDAVASYSTSEQ